MSEADKTLIDTISQAQNGSREAFARLLEDHYDTIYRFAYRYTESTPDAEDITQNVCIKLAKSLSQYRSEAKFTTWLYRIVLNTAKDHARSTKRHEPSAPQLPEQTEQPDLSTPRLLDQILGEIDKMGTGFKETVLLVIAEGLSHAEAGEILDVSESTISWRLFETRKRLKANTEIASTST